MLVGWRGCSGCRELTVAIKVGVVMMGVIVTQRRVVLRVVVMMTAKVGLQVGLVERVALNIGWYDVSLYISGNEILIDIWMTYVIPNS